MSEDDKDKINVVNDQSSDDNEKNQSGSVDDQSKNNDDLQSGSESYISVDQSTPNTTNEAAETPDTAKTEETKQEDKKEHEVIHKKDGSLHIYVRQDKYKGEWKSKNWVGRLYIDGKQKISSSGTPNLEEAIPILEKWFDDIHANKEKEKEIPKTQETQDSTSQVSQTSTTSPSQATTPTIETSQTPAAPTITETPKPVLSPVKNENNIQQQSNTNDNKETVENKKSVSGLLKSPISIAKPVLCSEYPGGADTLALSVAIWFLIDFKE